MNNRLSELIASEDITAGKLADMLGVQRSGISHIITGRNKPGYDFITALLQRFPHVNPDWFLLGKGNMYRDVSSSQSPLSKGQETCNDNTSTSPKEGAVRTINKIIIFYSDGTFSSYRPE